MGDLEHKLSDDQDVEFFFWGRGKERGKERIPSRLRAVSVKLDVGLDPQNCEIMT